MKTSMETPFVGAVQGTTMPMSFGLVVTSVNDGTMENV